ncbi:MAG: hypothetical protein PWQ82_1006 [Thermosediminibacterales bacterium]|nr:hypothetical protein [Thermosediminibacterales bacterium]MDK2836192.1 hypothetical protein [Thermosediminibacterales bacterium]
MSVSHWLYVIGVLVVVLTMIIRRNVIIPCLVFTFLIGWVFKGSFIDGIMVMFNASIVAAKDLFSIFLIIGLMVAMLKSLSVTGADRLLVLPLQKMMKSPLISYIVIIVSTLVISLFFWPTPAVPLIGALLVPAAIKSGLPPMMAAMAMALAGQGMALSGDVIIQGAPGLTASAAGVPVQMLTARGGMLSFIAGTIAIILGWWLNQGEIKAFQTKQETAASDPDETGAAEKLKGSEEQIKFEKKQYAPLLKNLLIVAMLGVIVALFAFDIKGGDASALLGGVAFLIMIVASLLVKGAEGLDTIGDYIADGLVFAFRVMGPIIPIAGFFFLGSPEAVAGILGEGAPGFLFDVGKMISEVIPPTGFLAGFGMLILGAITGLDGSGFSGLPLVGTLAGAMAAGSENVAATLGAIGQLGAIWAGGGTLVAWCSLVAVAGIVNVSVLELVRKNFIPVVTGLVIATIVGVLMM